MSADALADRMKHLSMRFIEGLPGDLAIIAADADAASGVVHRIAGRAGTFGFPEVSEAAAHLEAVIATGGATGPLLAAGLAALVAAADRARG